ncbi:sigma-54-dependent transcriptional regulator [Maridesulfovibrio hydrothermalis]|uniref:Two component, sigma54 specific, transcriptional regulator, Fis family n=1 Tax=Maridesulfovibrio hydrothermalis AM13 = DSM 14728 TaxID=1121451 RepID=L0RD21_9BACT|nr:sigma-54 dependent transcriptional regulator [Maridesulfovibrio hydrothermalis]CCO24122.1 Two component, sigma54 specific, transcriptional regulator, Fis family [Maridesulfovibrio hydrothermalis AM13 = DSM 14728]
MKNPVGILIVDDEIDFATGIARLIQRFFPHEEIMTVNSGIEALNILDKKPFGLLLTDLNMPGMDGAELLKKAIANRPDLGVVILTAFGTVSTAVKALKLGAYDFITKPVEPEALRLVVERGIERCNLLGENSRLKKELSEKRGRGELIGDCLAMRRLQERISAVAESDYTVLIRGESGTGKELVARTIHQLSNRSSGPLMTVNCPAISDQLLESELFGHVKGAFTGANRTRKGIFVNANKGTLLLDEIGDITSGIQTKLLRVLQEGEVRPVGSSNNVKVDVRIIASTNRNLEAKVADRSFRSDLYYRLNVLTLHVPTLGERKEDIPLLARHFLKATCKETGVPAKELSTDAVVYLSMRKWPGNIRELQNFIRRLTVFSPADVIEMAQIRMVESIDGSPQDIVRSISPYKEAKEKLVDDFTRTYTTELLGNYKGNVSEAARQSGLSRMALLKILKRLDIDADEFRHGGAG